MDGNEARGRHPPLAECLRLLTFYEPLLKDFDVLQRFVFLPAIGMVEAVSGAPLRLEQPITNPPPFAHTALS